MSATERNRTFEVLLVEDSPTDTFITVDALKSSSTPMNIHTVRNGNEALDFLHNRGEYADAPRPNIILLDINLPGKTGFEVLEEIKTEPSLEIIPVVILTTSSSQDDIIKSYRMHASSFMTKPVKLDQFTDAIRSFDNFWFAVVDLPILDH